MACDGFGHVGIGFSTAISYRRAGVDLKSLECGGWWIRIMETDWMARCCECDA